MQNELGKTLESLRKENKLSLREAAKLTGLSHAYIRDVELNMNRKSKEPVNPTTDTLQRLANAYKFPLETLLHLAGYSEVAIAFENILNDPDIPSKKKEVVKMIMQLDDNDKELDKIISILKAFK